MAIKNIHPDKINLVWKQDGSFEFEQKWYVDNLSAGTTEADRLLDAINEINLVIGELNTDNQELTDAGTRVLQMSAQLLTDSQATVTVIWGTSDEPILDGGWVYDIICENNKVTRAIDINGKLIVNKYYPPGSTLPDGNAVGEFFYELGNKRRFNPGVKVQGWRNKPHLVARRLISFDAASNMILHPNKWPANYVNWVNKVQSRAYTDPDVSTFYTAGVGVVTLPAGVWMCSKVDIYMKNNGSSLLVTAEMIYDDEGHEEYNFFIDNQSRSSPSDILIPTAMKLPWATTRGPTGPNYGVIRPQILKGLKDFSADPFDLRLPGL